MSNKETFYYLSSDQTTMIRGMRWIPDGNIKAILQLAHGMSEHIDRYEDFALYLRDRGILVTANDHLGHGESVLSTENLGYFTKNMGNQSILQDMNKLTHITKEAYPDIPFYILGHSMGSFLTRQYIGQYADEVDGAIIMGTGTKPEIVLKSGILLAKLISLFKGEHHRSGLLDRISFSGYTKRLEQVRTEFDWLTRDEKIVDSYIADDKCGFVFTLNGFYNMFYSISQAQKVSNLNKMNQELPVLFVAGEEDPVGDYGKGVLKVVRQFQRIGMKCVEYKLYHGDRHEILNELDRDKVYEDIYGWVNKSCRKM